MMLRSRPFLAAARARLTGPPSLGADAVETIVEHPAETGRMPGVAMNEADRARVTAAMSMTTLEHEWRRVDGSVAEHAATIRYVFEDVLATPWGFYTRAGGHNRGRPADLRRLATGRVARVAEGYFAVPSIAMRYFGHWLGDALPSALLRRPGEALYLPHDPRWRHAPEYRDALDLDALPDDLVHFERMSFCEDFGQNAGRAARLRAIGARVRARAGQGAHASVYLVRGPSKARRAALVNEDALVSALVARGFAVVDTTVPLADLWTEIGNARRVVTLEGSHWRHAFLAAAPDAAHVTINPADRFNNVFADYMPATGGRLATSVAVPVEGGYEADVPGILRLLDRLDAGA